MLHTPQQLSLPLQSQLSSVFLVVEPSKIIFLNTIPQKEDIILLHNGHHSIPQ